MDQVSDRLLLLPWHGILVSFQGGSRLAGIVNHPEVLHFSLIRAGKDKLLAIRTPKYWSSLSIFLLFFYLHIILSTITPSVLVICHAIGS